MTKYRIIKEELTGIRGCWTHYYIQYENSFWPFKWWEYIYDSNTIPSKQIYFSIKEAENEIKRMENPQPTLKVVKEINI